MKKERKKEQEKERPLDVTSHEMPVCASFVAQPAASGLTRQALFMRRSKPATPNENTVAKQQPSKYASTQTDRYSQPAVSQPASQRDRHTDTRRQTHTEKHGKFYNTFVRAANDFFSFFCFLFGFLFLANVPTSRPSQPSSTPIGWALEGDRRSPHRQQGWLTY